MHKDINEIIASRLTELYIREKELPRIVDIWTENTSPEYYRFIVYNDKQYAFYFACWRGDDDETAYISIDGGSPIDYKRAIREVYELLDETEKTELMAKVLGNKNEN